MTIHPQGASTAGRHIESLRSGIASNLAGQIIPGFTALVAIPVIQRNLGDAQLGILMLSWALVGYLGVFDLGFRRALAQVVAAERPEDATRVSALIWTAHWFLATLGLTMSAILVAASPWLIPPVTATGTTEIADAWTAVITIAASLPCVTVASGLCGVIEGHRRFGLLNAVRTPTAVAGYLGPMAASLLSASVAPAIIVLAVTRIAGTIGLVALAVHVRPGLRQVSGSSAKSLRSLAATGGWMTVANVAGSVMLYLDRLVVGALTPLAAVAYYTTPQDVINKLLVFPAAVSTAAFPVLASLWTGSRAELSRVYERATMATLVTIFPPLLAISVLAPDWLGLWVGASFAEHAMRVVWLASPGTLLAGVAASPLALLQASGRAHLTAAFQLALVPVYATMAWLLTRTYGIDGAAASWTGRMVLESALLFGAAERVAPGVTRHWLLGVAAGVLALAPVAAASIGPVARVLLIGLFASAAIIVADRCLGLRARLLRRQDQPRARHN